MELPSSPTLEDRTYSFELEVSNELARQHDLLHLAKGECRHQYRRLLIPLLLMVLSAAAIVFYPKALWSWFISALFLYSWNFLFLLIPSTTAKNGRKEGATRPKRSLGERLASGRKLLGKKKLTVEIALTLFLGRMVPLTASFTLMLGLGMGLLVYFVLTDYTAASGLTRLLIVQVVFILTFYGLVNALRPQSQGITRIARAWKVRLGVAKGRGRGASTLVKMAAIGVVASVLGLAVGAMVLPGITFLTLLASLGDFSAVDILLSLGIFPAQLWIMRAFQSVMSRRMAIEMLNMRIARLQALRERAEALEAQKLESMDGSEALQALKCDFYSMMIYEVYRLDLFGRSPVYLVGPRAKYVLDERALCHLP
ncbi:MAG: hypothetical protein A4E29_00747 [Methanomassiliicoccales archaeon PtaB.Bin134]|nr:MAG: hypothetical protein A4E29_00747 [Methanomassiliicoccales archaeon PtaB.Bin134]